MSKVFPLKREKVVDRSIWPPGPWDSDPVDYEQWEDSATGLPCLIERNPLMGSLCGYAGVYRGHPLYSTCDVRDDYMQDDCVSVHGGIGWAGFLELDPRPPAEEALTEEPDEVNVADVLRMPLRAWFFGFDCGHYTDAYPLLATFRPIKSGAIYRDAAYVKRNCEQLARYLYNRRGD